MSKDIMNIFRKIIYPLTIIGVIAGCAQPAITPTQTAVPLTSPSTTALVATATPNTSPTPNILSTPTTQPTPTISIEKNCLTLEDQLPPDLNLTGVWIRQPGTPY